MRAPEGSIKARLRQLLDQDEDWEVSLATHVSGPFVEDNSTTRAPCAGNYNDMTPPHNLHMAPSFTQDLSRFDYSSGINGDTHGTSSLLPKSKTLGDAPDFTTHAMPNPVNAQPKHKSGHVQDYAKLTRSLPATSIKLARESTSSRLVNDMGRAARDSGTLQPAYSSRTTLAITSRALLQLISRIIRLQKEKSCTILPDDEHQTGMYPCTFGCGHAFKNAADLFRHQSILFPQEFWFCAHCGNPEHPSTKHLFTRKDKFRKHLGSNHPDVEMSTVGQFKVRGVSPDFPERCGLCLHHRHTSWEDRCKHIIKHCKDGDFLGFSSRRRSPSRELALVDDQEDDDDNNGDEDDDGGDDDGDQDGADNDPNGHTKVGPFDESPNRDNDNTPDADFSFGPDIDNALDLDQWFSFESLGYPTSIKLQRLADGCQEETKQPHSYPIRWLDRVNKKGATASVYKVALELDLKSGETATNKFYAVKQYVCSRATSAPYFHQELQAFTLLEYQASRRSTSIVQCYGTFEYTDKHGRLTQNLLLEYGDCDLREYRADTPIPYSCRDAVPLWSSLCNVAQAIHSIHTFKEDEDQQIYGRHGDIKPDNILRFGNTFKLADLGFTHFVDAERVTIKDETVKGPIKLHDVLNPLPAGRSLGLQGSTQSEHAATAIAKDIWDFGHVLVSTISWVVLGFDQMQRFEQHFPPCQKESDADADELRLAVRNLRNFIQTQTERYHAHLLTAKMLDFAEQMLHSDRHKRSTALQLMCDFGNRLVPRSSPSCSPASLIPSWSGLDCEVTVHTEGRLRCLFFNPNIDCPMGKPYIMFGDSGQFSSDQHEYEATDPPSLVPAPYSASCQNSTNSASGQIKFPPLLWIKGLAGAGKSKLAKTLLDYQERGPKHTSHKSLCEICGSAFEGKYRRGNAARHMRHFHGGEDLVSCRRPNALRFYQDVERYSRKVDLRQASEGDILARDDRYPRAGGSHIEHVEEGRRRTRPDTRTILQPISMVNPDTFGLSRARLSTDRPPQLSLRSCGLRCGYADSPSYERRNPLILRSQAIRSESECTM